eukprot:1189139-Amphidinium_carterae.1
MMHGRHCRWVEGLTHAEGTCLFDWHNSGRRLLGDKVLQSFAWAAVHTPFTLTLETNFTTLPARHGPETNRCGP